MSEHLPDPERARMTDAQDATLRALCDRYQVEYDPAHYIINALEQPFTPGWAEGWVGGYTHANPEYARPSEPVSKPTIYVGVDPDGRSYS